MVLERGPVALEVVHGQGHVVHRVQVQILIIGHDEEEIGRFGGRILLLTENPGFRDNRFNGHAQGSHHSQDC